MTIYDVTIKMPLNYLIPHYSSEKLQKIEKTVAIKKWKRSHLFAQPEGFPLKTTEEFDDFESGDETRHDELVS